MIRARVLLSLLLANLFLLCIPASHAENCSPPSDMSAKLMGTPSVETLNDLGEWFAQHDQFSCAAQAFATSLQSDLQQPDLPHIAFEFGAALFFSGDIAGSIAALQQAESLGYRDVHLNLLLASAFDVQHATPDAIQEWRKALDFDPEAAVELDSLSTDLVAEHEYQEVIDLLEQPRVGPNRTARQYINLGSALVALGRTEEAANILEDGLNTYASSAELVHQLTTVLTDLHRDEEAAQVLGLSGEEQSDTTEPAD